MKILAEIILHYGSPYLEAVLSSLSDQVDTIVVLYTASPSQGFHTQMACPDTQEQLKAVVDQFPKAIWHEGSYNYEGEHVEAVNSFTAGYDWVIRADSDEVYQPGSVARLLEQAEVLPAKIFRVPFLHFWRSFARVCRDGQMPDRITRVNGGEGFAYLDDGFLIGKPEINRVLHFGYAQPTRFIEYKMEVQAHKPEWRPDWFQTKWLPNAQEDVHPVVFNFWNTESYDKDTLPTIIKEHPYFDMEVIDD